MITQVVNALGYTEEDVKAAWDRIESYAEELSGQDCEDRNYSTSAEELMSYADSHVNDHGRWGGDYLVMGGLLEGKYPSSEFWDNYEIIRGIRIEERHNFFSCSC